MKREALAIVKHYERAAGHPIYIVEDAAYRDLRFEGDDVPSFKSLDPHNERVVYANTLTKPFATGFRLGYGILPPPLMRAVPAAKATTISAHRISCKPSSPVRWPKACTTAICRSSPPVTDGNGM